MPINLTTLATNALGFSVALAWNEAVSQSLKSFYPPKSEKAAARHTIVYALVITLLVIVVVLFTNHTRKLVHNHFSGGLVDHFTTDPPKQGLSPIVRLWEPPQAHKPAR